MKRRVFLLRVSQAALATQLLVSYRSDGAKGPEWSLKVLVPQLLLFPSCRHTRQQSPDWCDGIQK